MATATFNPVQEYNYEDASIAVASSVWAAMVAGYYEEDAIGYTNRASQRYNLASLAGATINSATLYIYTNSSANLPITVTGFAEANEVSMPGTAATVWARIAGGTSLGTIGTGVGWKSLNITSFVNTHKGGTAQLGFANDSALRGMYADSSAANKSYIVVDYTTGGPTQVTKTHTLDAIIYQTPTKTYTTDGIIKVSDILKTHTVDGLLSSSSTKTFTLDCILDTSEAQKITAYVDGVEPSIGDWTNPIQMVVEVGQESAPVAVTLKSAVNKTFTGDYVIYIDGTYASRYALSADNTNWEQWGYPLKLTNVTINNTGTVIYIKKRALAGDPTGDTVRACLKLPYKIQASV